MRYRCCYFSRVGKVVDGQKEIVFGAGMEAVGPVICLSSATYADQHSVLAKIEAPEADWICKDLLRFALSTTLCL